MAKGDMGIDDERSLMGEYPDFYSHGKKPIHEVLSQHALTTPQKVALNFYGREMNYGELDHMVNRFAVYLLQLGVKEGDRIALFLHNCPQYMIAHFAVQKIGAIVSPCSPSFKAMELSYQISDMVAKIVITSDTLYPIVTDIQEDSPLQHIIVTHYGDLLPGDPSFHCPDELLQERRATPLAHDFFTAIEQVTDEQVEYTVFPSVALEDVSLLVYTSGSTGRPKGAMLSYGNALFKTAASAMANEVLDGDRILAVMPLCHIAGMLMGMTIPIYTGCKVVLLYRFDPVAVAEAIAEEKCTWWYSTAPMNVAIMQAIPSGRYNWSSLTTNVCTSFGIQLTEDIANRWRAYTSGTPVYEAAYGLSETHTADTYMPRHAIKWGTQGIPIYETEIRIVDLQTGENLPVLQDGEIVVRSPGVFKGYWRNIDATKKTLRDGWVYTGDLGRIDSDGYLTFIGRIKEMMKVSGFSVFPEEVEALLMHHPAIAQVAVIGIPDEKRGEVVKAFVVCKSSEEDQKVVESDIIEWAKENMASYKVPRYVEFREQLPMSSAGKILRRLLIDGAS
ncbi:MAG: AMP-binding protein [Acidibacillus sp.]|nr:AMP-binding protein [Acidibacillus sp.]